MTIRNSLTLAALLAMGCGDGGGSEDELASRSRLEVTPTHLVADGDQVARAVLTLRDDSGNPVDDADVRIYVDHGLLEQTVKPTGNGTYIRKILATPGASEARVTASVDGKMLPLSAVVSFEQVPGIQKVSIDSDAIHDFVLVGVHPNDLSEAHWPAVFDTLDLDFVDRNYSGNASWYQLDVSYKPETFNFTLGRGLPSASYFGLHPLDFDDGLFTRDYRDFAPPDQRWTDLDGNEIDEPITAGAARDRDGNLMWLEPGSRPFLSYSNPNWLDYNRDAIRFAVQDGLVQGINYDFLSTTTLQWQGSACGDFSPWAIATMRDHLAQRYDAAELAALGVPDVTELDIRDYVVAHPPPQNQDDPLLKEFMLNEVKQHMQLAAKLRDHTHTVGKEVGSFVPFYGNQYIGNTRLSGVLGGIHSLSIGQSVDLVQIETYPAVYTRPRPNQTGNERAFTNYQLGHASAEHDKPVWSLHAPFPAETERADVTKSFDAVQRLYMAEAYAAGAIPELDLSGWPGMNSEGIIVENGALLPGTVRYVDFVKANRDLLRRTKSGAKTAIVLSFPTHLWNSWQFWERPGNDYRLPLLGYLRALEQWHMPYDVLLFGHPDLWDDEKTLDRLAGYDHVILPMVECLSETQRSALESYLVSGGHVIVAGTLLGTGSHDEDRVPVGTWLPELMLQHPKLAIDTVSAQAAADFVVDEKDSTALQAPFSGAASPLEIAPDPLLGANLRKQEGRLIVHLVNYDGDYMNDELTTKTNLPVSVGVTGVTSVEYHDVEAGTTTTLPTTEALGRTNFTVPSLTVWGVAVVNVSAPP